MNYRAWHDDMPLIEPVYYLYPDRQEAYSVRNEYFFGSQLLVNPITHKKDAQTTFASELTWIPEGRWTDVFTGAAYRGGRMIRLHRYIDSIPVLAKAGAIIPLASKDSIGCSVDVPDKLDLYVFAGDNGSFSLYEDDGVSCGYREGRCAFTDYRLCWGEEKAFEGDPVRKDRSFVPQSREISVYVYGVPEDSVRSITVSGLSKEPVTQYDESRRILKITVGTVRCDEGFRIIFREDTDLSDNPLESWAYRVIRRAEIDFAVKEELFAVIRGNKCLADKLSVIDTKNIPDEMKSCLTEILTAL